MNPMLLGDNGDIAMEKHNLNMQLDYKWARFYSYVSLPEGFSDCVRTSEYPIYAQQVFETYIINH